MHLQPWGAVKNKGGDFAVNFLKKLVSASPKLGKDGKPVLDRDKKPVLNPERIAVLAPTADGSCHDGRNFLPVRRGDILGYCGSIPDNISRPSKGIHFEIFFEDIGFLTNFTKAMWGKTVARVKTKVFTDLPESVTVAADPSRPINVDKNSRKGQFWRASVAGRQVWIEKTFIEVRDSEKTGISGKPNKPQTQFFLKSENVKAYKQNPAEIERELDAGEEIIPWKGPWLKAGEFREESLDGKFYIQVYLPKSNEIFWAERDSIEIITDADWPGFSTVSETGMYSSDGFVDAEGLVRLVKLYEKNVQEKDGAAVMGQRDKLRHIVTKHTSEWSGRNIATRFQRVAQEEFGPSKLTQEQFTRLVAHIEKLSFWESVPGLPADASVWHVHPIKFIEHLAKCMWLTKDELALIYPNRRRSSDDLITHGTSESIREKYRIDLNKCCYKYGINSRLRQAHFFGQGAVECASLNSMLEDTTGTKYENKRSIGNTEPGDGPKFIGRGFKQLTGRYNYAQYWVFRGWLRPGRDFDLGWEIDLNKQHPIIDNPDIILNNVFNAIDAGCWYITVFRKGAALAMDRDDGRAATYAINGGYTDLPKRLVFTNWYKDILL
ncbi:glycoside hydrolase family 19 protein [Pseudoduganella buxea]|uniref:Chitinase n=1 Tax=Pseudoduganella buxea TaxID=1949069 RepID=A0A6I3T118_9BURK|nr:hypothetical protein [Pseudoduganella buxea]MTV54182.1 hypothetical protein [Pseudoduganella buxea]GGC15180.1 hypothetical protein GCM10011572_40670 [Pseudoduganella buxea]